MQLIVVRSQEPLFFWLMPPKNTPTSRKKKGKGNNNNNPISSSLARIAQAGGSPLPSRVRPTADVRRERQRARSHSPNPTRISIPTTPVARQTNTGTSTGTMAIISSPHLARWAQLDQNLLAWLEKSALGHTDTDGIPLRLSQLGYFTIQDILLFDPDDLHEDLKEYESSAGTVEILKGQRLKFLRSRCYTRKNIT